MKNHLPSVAGCQTENEMKLDACFACDPFERAVSRLIASKLDELIAPSSSSHAIRYGIMCAMLDIIADGVHDLIEPIVSVAPRTGHLVINFRISDTFDAALTRATENCNFSHNNNSYLIN